MYSRVSRLTTDTEFGTVKKYGKRFSCPYFTVYFYQSPKLSRSQIGFIVTNKAGKAHLRNYIKRRLRMLFRAWLDQKSYFWMVVVGKSEAAVVSYETLKVFESKAFQFLIKK